MQNRALVEAPELSSLLASVTPPLVLDVRWSLAGSDLPGYAAGHVPGAVFCDLDADLAAPPGEGGRHPLPSAEALSGTLRRLGVAPGRTVVVYDDAAGASAARAWWCLRWAGHADVRVLDGGLAAWRAAGGPLEVGVVAPVPHDAAVARLGGMAVATVDDVVAGRAGTLLDARAAERYRGEVEPVDPVAGHIPGAVSCPTTLLQRPDGRYRPAPELRALLAGLIGSSAPDGPVTAYCGSGVTASQIVLAAHDAGLDLALYPGSWSHWVRDPARPVATGEGTG